MIFQCYQPGIAVFENEKNYKQYEVLIFEGFDGGLQFEAYAIGITRKVCVDNYKVGEKITEMVKDHIEYFGEKDYFYRCASTGEMIFKKSF